MLRLDNDEGQCKSINSYERLVEHPCPYIVSMSCIGIMNHSCYGKQNNISQGYQLVGIELRKVCNAPKFRDAGEVVS